MTFVFLSILNVLFVFLLFFSLIKLISQQLCKSIWGKYLQCSFNLWPPFTHFPNPCLWQPLICSLYIWALKKIFLGCIYEKSYNICLFLSNFTYIMPQRSIHVVASGNISFFLCLSNIPLYIHVLHLLYPLIYWWARGLFPYLGYCK